MKTRDVPLGRCPGCQVSIPWAHLLIEYRRSCGEHAVFAECPNCEAVVSPE